MRRFYSATTVTALLAGLSTAAAAQDLFIASSNNYIALTRGTDKNGNAYFNDVGEYTKAAYDPTKIDQSNVIRYTGVFGVPTILWLDNQNSKKSLVALKDLNGNGVFEPSEMINLFTGFHTIIGATAANTFLGGMTVSPAGVVHIANNQFVATPPPTNGIYRVTNITTTPVVAAAIRQADSVTAWENSTTATAITINAGAWEQIAQNDSTGAIYAYNTLDDVIYKLQDLDADGKFTTPGECINFLNVGNHKAGLAKNNDFFGGPYSVYGATFGAVVANATGNRITLLQLEVRQSDGALFVGTRTQTTSGGAELTAGKIFKCVDLNGNGTCNDPGEVTLMVSDSTAGAPDAGKFIDPATGFQYAPSTANPGWTGMSIDQSTGELYALSNAGPKDPPAGFALETVWKFVDLDNDGAFNSPGEQLLVHFQKPAGSLSNDLEVCPAGTFSPNFPSMSQFEAPGSQSAIPNTVGCVGSTNFNLQTSCRFYQGAPYLGNTAFQISVTGTFIGNTYAQLYFSEADWDASAVNALWNLLNGPPYFTGLPYPSNLASRNLDEWLSFFPIWVTSSPSYIDIFDLAATGTSYIENVPGGLITGAGGVAGAAAYADNRNVTCALTAGGTANFIGRHDCTIAIPNAPQLAGKTFRFQWHTQDPTGSAGLPRVVSDVGIITLF